MTGRVPCPRLCVGMSARGYQPLSCPRKAVAWHPMAITSSRHFPSAPEPLMPSPITIRYPVRPRARSLAAGEVADLFGLADDEPPHVVADNVTLDVRPGDVVLFTGPSGSGKSSLLREVGRQ